MDPLIRTRKGPIRTADLLRSAAKLLLDMNEGGGDRNYQRRKRRAELFDRLADSLDEAEQEAREPVAS